MKLLFPVALLALGCGARAVSASADSAARELECQWRFIAHPDAGVGIRGVFRFALEAAGNGWHSERVTSALALARSMQDLDPASKTRGNFRWRYGQARVFDPNAVEFSLQQAVLLRRRFATALTPAALKLLDRLIADGIGGMIRQKVTPAYTNIYLMKTWNLIGAGEALGRPEVADRGYRQLDDWLRYTAAHGITEYGAVTYYGIDLDSLALIAKFAARPAARAKAETALRYLWTDIAANWYAPGARLGGANARSYDYLYGHGYLEAHTWAAGWLPEKPVLENAGWLPGPREHLTVLLDACRWDPPAALTAPIRAQLPRVVVQRWGAAPGQLAVNYVGTHFSLASSGAAHSSDDRALVADLGDSPAIPQLTLFMDGRGDPYGLKKSPEAQGAMKALHLTPFIAAVQRGPELVQVLSDDPAAPHGRRQPGSLAAFYTQLTLPAAAEVWFGDTPAQPGPPDHPALVPANTPVFVRLGGAVVAVRFLLATATDGQTAPIYFIADQPGFPARRLTVVHSAHTPRGRGTTVVWMRAADGLDDAGFAAFRHAFTTAPATVKLTGDVLRVAAAGEHGELRIEANLAQGERLQLAGGEPPALLSVNGRDYGAELLRAWQPQ